MANDWIKLSCQVDHRQHEETEGREGESKQHFV